ncbi:NAD(P)-binding domain-containing protein [Frigoriglobus tundricola]|uniref:FAD-dependent pyridine nucleotide-disulfide oxidoreductase n=1 Tax=Frigoriglobus tundricola TaxID=2774151 RepID=A0A6M5YWH3_9BACT|nr:NAD(P)/FAD-dependent oxidoreductase [Frigoriglobus tundricola]QJW97746.1 FAD-dependent pyridine nucleotide-disulfide oxidoreductase [Frigoriglobus tundricola]
MPHEFGLDTDVVIVGAGPYGLSIAAHLRAAGVPFRIFGRPMSSWKDHMPRGMFLKSEGFASGLYDPHGSFTLADYYATIGRPYHAVGDPVPLETFVAYGTAFQQRFVPDLDPANVEQVTSAPGGFEVTTSGGETLRARNVVVAAGITHFGYLPPVLSGHSGDHVTHSSDHADVSAFRGRSVAVIGAGASAVDIAAALHESGADVRVIARRESVAFHDRPAPRSLVQKVRAPRSGLGVGWRSWLCTHMPLVFHSMPLTFRTRVVQRHLGPAPGWFMKDRVVGQIPLFLGSTLTDVSVRDGKVHLAYRSAKDGAGQCVVDHVIGATGFRVDINRLSFIAQPLRSRIRCADGSPVLGRHFESSVKGLYVTGVAAANSFGPLMRFACGAQFTARRLAKRLAGRRPAVTPDVKVAVVSS